MQRARPRFLPRLLTQLPRRHQCDYGRCGPRCSLAQACAPYLAHRVSQSRARCSHTAPTKELAAAQPSVRRAPRWGPSLGRPLRHTGVKSIPGPGQELGARSCRRGLTWAQEGPAARVARPARGLGELVGGHLVEDTSDAAVAFVPPASRACSCRTHAIQRQGPGGRVRCPSHAAQHRLQGQDADHESQDPGGGAPCPLPLPMCTLPWTQWPAGPCTAARLPGALCPDWWPSVPTLPKHTPPCPHPLIHHFESPPPTPGSWPQGQRSRGLEEAVGPAT